LLHDAGVPSHIHAVDVVDFDRERTAPKAEQVKTDRQTGDQPML
jgi:hypothetical protein